MITGSAADPIVATQKNMRMRRPTKMLRAFRRWSDAKTWQRKTMLSCPFFEPRCRLLACAFRHTGFKTIYFHKNTERKFSTSSPTFSDEISRLQTSQDYPRYFIAQRDVLKPPDVCLILEGLWEKIRHEHEGQRLPNAKKELFNNPDFMEIMKDVLFKLERYKAEDLPRLVAILNSMRWNDKQLFKILEPAVIREMPSMSCRGLSQIAQGFTGVGCGSRFLFNQLVQGCFQNANHFEPEEVALLASAFSKAPHKPRQFLLGFAPTVSNHLSSFSENQLKNVILAYSQWPQEISSDFMEDLLHVAEQRVHSNMLTLQNLVLLLRFVALWKSRSKVASKHRRRSTEDGKQQAQISVVLSNFFILSNEQLHKSTNKLTVEQTSQVMWSYCKLQPHGIVPKKLFELLYHRILQNFSKLSVPSLAHCLLNTAKAVSGKFRFWDESASSDLGFKVHGEMRDRFADRGLLRAAESEVVKHIGDTYGMESRYLTAVVQAYSISHVGSAESFSIFLRAATDRCQELAPEQLSALLWSFATVRLGPSFARHAQIHILERLSQFEASHLCDILWAYCVLRHRDAHFFATLLRVLSPSVAGDIQCALLCPAILEIRTYFPSMDPEGLERYRCYVEQHFKRRQMQIAAPQTARESLANCLSKAGMKNVQQLVYMDGYIVDLIVPTDNGLEKPVAIQYHTAPRTLHLATGEPLGQTMMKQSLVPMWKTVLLF